ncbi:MAG: tRNA pseudouridine(38-40) synthase TruA, partial [Verrucomicrobiota bacterium]
VFHFGVAYDGTEYAGWQVQPSAKTVQNEIEWRLARLYDVDKVNLYGTSRTDAGVHAGDQRFSFTPPTPGRFTPEKVKFLLNRWLAKDIRIHDAREEQPGFHARKSAVAKAYIYSVRYRESYNPFLNRYFWDVNYPLRFDRMERAAELLTGTHDFAAFAAKAHRDIHSTSRHIFRLEIKRLENEFYIIVIGDSFLYKMVRSLAGYLILRAGRSDEWEEKEVIRLLQGKEKERPHFVETAPARGLFLDKVFFREDEMATYQPQLPPFFNQNYSG